MGRAALGWSSARLAQEAKLSLATISRLERKEGNTTVSTLRQVQEALEKQGVIFINHPERGPGCFFPGMAGTVNGPRPARARRGKQR
jgi:transcriptional regulator with XRE-family HTH domain